MFDAHRPVSYPVIAALCVAAVIGVAIVKQLSIFAPAPTLHNGCHYYGLDDRGLACEQIPGHPDRFYQDSL